MEPQYVHVSLGQFESTAIQKLVARGIREDVARAFVTEGLRKQDGYNRYKEIVCRAKFHSFFVHDPTIGSMVPTVLERKTNKFKAPFSMSGKEKADLISSFPELDVMCDGTIRNAHSFYANKRLAECELLISLVWSTAASDGALNPRSVVDVGGNQTQHTGRSRGYVHCDTPILSAKDISRYTIREVYSGVDPGSVCRQSFHSCRHRADFGIGIHSTYDLSPQSIAEGMEVRGMKWFFGVVNIHPGLSSLSSGEYIHDGMVLKVSSNEVGYSFVHDPSLTYTHSKYNMSQYLSSQLYLPVKTSTGTKHYVFKHHSCRGATIVFSVSETDGPVDAGTSIATGMRSGKYRIHIADNDLPVDVDAEMFDRLVLMAAASRKIEEYNITALFKYAKSLRQRISINSIVLSSGFSEDASTLVKITVAAMAVASAYHYESARFFQTATKQVMLRRHKSIVEDVFSVSSSLVKTTVDTIFRLTGATTGFNALRDWANDILKAATSVKVEVATIKDFGGRFDPKVLGPLRVQMGKPDTAEWFSGRPSPITDASFDWTTMSYVVVENSGFPGHEEYTPSCFSGYGYRDTYPNDLKLTECLSGGRRLIGISSMKSRAVVSRTAVYKAFLAQSTPFGETDGRTTLLSNGDSLVHVVARDPRDQTIEMQHCFVAFRGVGSRFVFCKPPKYYSSRCLAFVLFYEEDITEMAHLNARGQFDAESLPNPLYSVVRHCAGHLQYLGQSQGVAFIDEEGRTRATIGDLTGPPVGATAVGTRVEFAETERVRFHTAAADAVEFLAGVGIEDVDLSSDDESGVLDEAAAAMGNVSVGSGEQAEERTPVSGQTGGASLPAQSRYAASIHRSVVTEPGDRVVGGPASSGSAVGPKRASVETISDSGTVAPSLTAGSTDQFADLLRKGKQPQHRRNWASDSTSSVALVPGFPAISELMTWAEESSRFALSVGKRLLPFAHSAVTEDLGQARWHAIQSGLEGDVQICNVDDRGRLVEFYSGDALPHMAVTDGDDIFVVKSLPPSSGPYITYRELEVWTVSSIIAIASKCIFSEFSCEVELVKGPAGCGKTTEICRRITDGDLGMCETRAAARDTAGRLAAASPAVAAEYCTVDSFLINKGLTFNRSVSTLYIDEGLRLHAGKIWCLVKIIKPGKVVVFGDPQQIPLLAFTPNFEFQHSVFPWSKITTLRRTYRLPADITMMLVASGYYDYFFKTHSKVTHGFKGVKQFYQGIFKDKPEGTVVLTYTKSAAEDLRLEGVKPVMTIGESQGKDLDDVWLYRESDLAKDIYYNREQTLTAITRVKKSFVFIPVSPFDDSEIQTLVKLLDDPVVSATVTNYQFN